MSLGCFLLAHSTSCSFADVAVATTVRIALPSVRRQARSRLPTTVRLFAVADRRLPIQPLQHKLAPAVNRKRSNHSNARRRAPYRPRPAVPKRYFDGCDPSTWPVCHRTTPWAGPPACTKDAIAEPPAPPADLAFE